jgi:xanthine dehydrogenase accessory factor
MRDVLGELERAIGDNRPAVYCRLVETRGSTPQKPGAAMLIFPDGSQVGTLGGGCVEAEVKRRALAVLPQGRGEILRFLLDHDYGWDDGLICGGRMLVLVHPLHAGRSVEYFATLATILRASRGCTEAVVIDSPTAGLPEAACYLFDEHGQWQGNLHDGQVTPPDWIRTSLRALTDRPKPYVHQGVAFLPTLPRCRLIIVGGGHIGQAVAALAADLDFEVWVVDDRADYVTEARFPKATRRIAGTITEVLPSLPIDSDTYCLIVTRGHHHDEQALYCLATRGARYVGMIGSRRKIRLIFDDLRAAGIPQEALDQVYAPVGIDIGSQTVPEIAVSICAELVSHRNRQGQVPGRSNVPGKPLALER